ncbi:MAG: NADPH-dependent F420 reductase [Acidobacteria bacterium]|nr:NADPH-dependent F420 reductase [Acidobacteriota bacterium]
MKIGMLGAGNVGQALGQGWMAAGHEVKFGSRQPGSVEAAIAFGDVVALATPWDSTEAVLGGRNLAGKILLDATNPIAPGLAGLTHGLNDSGGEQVARWAPGARVVKIFNTIGANMMADPVINGQAATMLYCGDDAEAKQVAAGLAAELGFEPMDAGPLEQARYLEPLAMLWITMALKYGHGREMGFKLLKRS